MNNDGNEYEMNSANNYVTEEQIRKNHWNVISDVPAILFAKVGAAVMLNRKRIARKPFLLDNNSMTYTFDKDKLDSEYTKALFEKINLPSLVQVGALPSYNASQVENVEVKYPKINEQIKIGGLIDNMDNLITLHQHIRMGDKRMIKNKLFSVYYESWIKVYKEGAIRKVTMDKYKLTLSWIKKLAPKMTIKDLNRITYQELLNGYAEYHERQSTMDFHHQLKGAILDAVDEGLIDRDPTRKAIIKGKSPRNKKIKYLNQFELHKLISDLDLGNELNYDWLILLIAKTGMRFSEALAVTPKDFDLMHQMLIINKTWNYKDGGGFSPTKNQSSNRKIQIDWQTAMQFAELIKELPEDKPIFAFNKVYNSTINDILSRHCRKMEIPVISVHGLRHTHASILLFAGVSIASVAHRLGHSSMTTTQKTYLHIIQELENADIDLIMRSLSSLNI